MKEKIFFIGIMLMLSLSCKEPCNDREKIKQVIIIVREHGSGYDISFIDKYGKRFRESHHEGKLDEAILKKQMSCVSKDTPINIFVEGD